MYIALSFWWLVVCFMFTLVLNCQGPLSLRNGWRHMRILSYKKNEQVFWEKLVFRATKRPPCLKPWEQTQNNPPQQQPQHHKPPLRPHQTAPQTIPQHLIKQVIHQHLGSSEKHEMRTSASDSSRILGIDSQGAYRAYYGQILRYDGSVGFAHPEVPALGGKCFTIGYDMRCT